MIWVTWGAGLMAAAVGIGAFAAHALKTRLAPELLQVFEVGVRYHVYHALALFVVAWLATVRGGSLVNAAGVCFVAGVVIFSGSLYAYALTGVTKLGMITPIGGLLFIVGWVLIFLAAAPARLR